MTTPTTPADPGAAEREESRKTIAALYSALFRLLEQVEAARADPDWHYGGKLQLSMSHARWTLDTFAPEDQ